MRDNRLEASQYPTAAGAPVTDVYQGHAQEAAKQIVAVIEDVYSGLAEVSDRVVALYDRSRIGNGVLRSAQLAELRPLLFEQLGRRSHLVAGTGFIAAPDVLADVPRWLEWWELTAAGEHRFLDVDLDPDSVDFYDYTAAEWFEVPERTLERVIVGPYVDYGGTDAYMLTLTVPVTTPDTFLGVTGADVPAGCFEAAVLPMLRKIDVEAALLNANGRIIASNTPRKLQGSLLKESRRSISSGATDARERRDAMTHACPGLPWSLLTFPGRSPVSG